MKLIALDLSHKPLLDEKFKKLGLSISEYTFANLYLFRKLHRYQLDADEGLFVEGITRDGKSYLMPTFPLYEKSSQELVGYLEKVDFFFPISEEWVKLLDQNIFEFTYDESDSDYLFNMERMRTLPGRDLSRKRNLVKQFHEDYRVETVLLTRVTKDLAFEVLEKWYSNQGLVGEETDYESCHEAIELCEGLNLYGRIFVVDGRPEALIIGEKDTDEFMIHFAKANKEIKGLYQYIFQEFAQSLDSRIDYINMEQDMGLPQVRQTKHSYHPDKMLRKWRVSSKFGGG